MKDRFLQVLKWFFIVLGVIFFFQILLILGAIIGITGFANYDIKPFETKSNIKPFENLVKYLDDYKQANGQYPEDIKDIDDSVVLKEINDNKNYDFEYNTSDDENCYKIIAKPKEKSRNKNLTTKEYGRCSSKSSETNSQSESYIEYNSFKRVK